MGDSHTGPSLSGQHRTILSPAEQLTDTLRFGRA